MRRQPSFDESGRAASFQRSRIVCLFLALALCLGASRLYTPTRAAQADAADAPAFDIEEIEIRTHNEVIPLTVEIAATADQRMTGLIERTQLAADAGMLFLYPVPQPPEGGFWMYRTRIPLDIAFLNADGRIVVIDTMTPCASTTPSDCRPYLAGVEFSGALEVNQGFFVQHNIEVGDLVIRDTLAHTQ